MSRKKPEEAEEPENFEEPSGDEPFSITKFLAEQEHVEITLRENPSGKPLWGQLAVGLNGYVAHLPRAQNIIVSKPLYDNLQHAARAYPDKDGIPRNRDINVDFIRSLSPEEAGKIRDSGKQMVFPQRVVAPA